MISTLQKLKWSIRHRGVRMSALAAAKSLGRRLSPRTPEVMHPFDVEYGTDTGGLIPGGDLASGHSSDVHIAGYAGVPPSRFRNIIARWEASERPYPTSEYSFIDVGCGKGRALLLASESGFGEVIGVELNPLLSSIARNNVEIWSMAGRSRCPVHVHEGDALGLEWPDGPCVVFLFNPCDGRMMKQLAGVIATAFRNRLSQLDVLYYKPEQAEAFSGDFEMIWCEKLEISGNDLAADPVADPKDETRAYRLVRRTV